jgi:NADH-quinone oxidoreductase subunit C
MSDTATQADVPAAPPETRYGARVTYSRGQTVLHPVRGEYVKVITAIKKDGFETCADLCAVDYLGSATQRLLPDTVAAERFEVVVNVLSLSKRERLRVRVQVPAADPTVASLYDLYPGTEAMEREAYDLLGINFTGHPDLSRILMPDEWVGHPLRKDESVGRIPVQFKGAPQAR